MNNEIEFYEFDKSILSDVIAKHCRSFSKEKVEENITFKYLFQYLKYTYPDDYQNRDNGKKIEDHNAQRIIVEKNYISESFYKNHLRYYSTSYKGSSKFNVRIHFFSNTFEEEVFLKDGILGEGQEDSSHNEIWDSYLGYITIRPIGSSPFGVMVLKPYPYVRGHRDRYMNSIVENYRFDVFGKEIYLPTLSFHQEDAVVGVCATFAIWSAFHKLRKIYTIEMPSPYEITERAGLSPHDTSRLFPAIEGLDPYQIVSVFEKSGLTLEKISFRKKDRSLDEFKELIYAYNKCGIPLLLTYNYCDNGNAHLVTVAGYRMYPDEKILQINSDFDPQSTYPSLIGASIMRLYSHNDSFGPFAKIDFTSKTERGCLSQVFNKRKEAAYTLKTHQIKDDPKYGKCIEAIPTTLWIPLEPMVKVKFNDVKKSANNYHLFIVRSLNESFAPTTLLWDIYLTKAVDYKQSFIIDGQENITQKEVIEKIKLTSYPKYIWVASLISKEKGALLDLIYDASVLPHDNCLYQINYFDIMFEKAFKREINKAIGRKENNDLNFSPYPDQFENQKVTHQM